MMHANKYTIRILTNKKTLVLMKYSQNKCKFNGVIVNTQMINKHIICLKVIYYNFKLLDPNSAI